LVGIDGMSGLRGALSATLTIKIKLL